MNFRPLSLAIASFCLLPAGAQAITLTDYKDPTSTWEEAFLNGSFNAKSGNQDQTSYDLTVDTFYEHNFSSLARNWQIHLDGEADVSRGANAGDKTENNSNSTARANIDTYFKKHPKVFWFGRGDLGYRDDADSLRVEVGGGLGYGRVINATALAKVLRIEEELREHGVILGRISDDVYLELAQIIDRESEYKGKYGADEYKSYWISDFEAVLKRENLLRTDVLGAVGVLQMDKVLFLEPVSIRKHGWVVRIGAGVVVKNFEGDDSDPTLGIEYEYTHPSGYKGQFINRLSYSTIIGNNTDQRITNDMSYTHEVSDRIDWLNAWKLDWNILGGDAKDNISNTLSSSFRYYLTNRVAANATLSLTKTEDNVDGNDNDETDASLFFGVTYRLK
ncbi:MAG: DUF481 domain-containing protein [bacterium]